MSYIKPHDVLSTWFNSWSHAARLLPSLPMDTLLPTDLYNIGTETVTISELKNKIQGACSLQILHSSAHFQIQYTASRTPFPQNIVDNWYLPQMYNTVNELGLVKLCEFSNATTKASIWATNHGNFSTVAIFSTKQNNTNRFVRGSVSNVKHSVANEEEWVFRSIGMDKNLLDTMKEKLSYQPWFKKEASRMNGIIQDACCAACGKLIP